MRIGRLRDSSLIARKIAPIRLAVCASPDYLARHGVPKTPDDLANHNCLEYTYFESRGEWRLLAAGQHVIGGLVQEDSHPPIAAFGDAAGVELARLMPRWDQAQIGADVSGSADARRIVDRSRKPFVAVKVAVGRTRTYNQSPGRAGVAPEAGIRRGAAGN